MTEDEFGLNMDEVLETLASAEVVTLYFPALRKTLLFDGRSDGIEGPLVKVVDMAGSSEERFKSLRRLRPRFGRPEAIVFIPWARQVESLRRLGLIEAMMERCRRQGSDAAVNSCREAYRQLQEFEVLERIAVVKGEGYQSLWERGAS